MAREEGERACPVCASNMSVETRRGISIDVCRRHGIWLDHGELEALTGRKLATDEENSRAEPDIELADVFFSVINFAGSAARDPDGDAS